MVRLKLVSKSWKRVISDLCIPQLNSTLSGFFLHLETPTESFPIGDWVFTSLSGERVLLSDFCFHLLPFKPSPLKFFDCSNGFLLFCEPSVALHLVNPITKECIVVHLHGRKKTPPPEVVSFTFDHTGYHIVYITRFPLQVHVFSSETEKWTVFGDLYLDSTIVSTMWSKRLFFIRGFCYMLSFSGHMLKFGYKERGVTAIKLPEFVSIEKYIGSFGVSQGRLHYCDRVATYSFKIWMLEESKENWILKHSLCLQDLAAYQIPDLQGAKLLAIYGFHPTSDVLFIGHTKRIFSYHPRDKTFKNICTADPGKCISCGQFLVRLFSQNLILTDSFPSSIKKE
ncbi:hypothetical protein ACHQM5_026482 [Ranunculus cassubicifolius]